jgi:hypothetical protein
MTDMHISPEIAALRAAISYNPRTGDLRWRHDVPRRTAKAGDLCGCLNDLGYRTFKLKGKQYAAHRVAWAIHHGVWPAGVIDHRDHNKGRNAVLNLRDVTYAVNSQNRVRAQRRNASGLLGVFPHRSKWVARITAHGKRTFLGVFESPAAAHDAYLTAKRQLHAGCTI